MNFQPIDIAGSNQTYIAYNDEINRYQANLEKELAREDSNPAMVLYYQEEIQHLQKLARIVQQKELLRTKTHTKITELQEDLEQLLRKQKEAGNIVLNFLGTNAKKDYDDMLKGTSSDSLRLAMADILLLTEDLEEAIENYQ
ncbi:hypothetical protein [Isobaculum melis]|uniref:Uncharacterized protein n=1 Tax=Isobaculum melis TaxID=142588 RepID=A0A1H9TL37_9LACT|nr:hypothetical protein [Isobaculum melis]SER97343.1 hypothetical protein SAMN04488559_11416 [Isobaculum melis]